MPDKIFPSITVPNPVILSELRIEIIKGPLKSLLGGFLYMADNTHNSEFRYTITLSYLNTKKNTAYNIKDECIKNIIIDHNFESNCMPIIYADMNLDKALISNNKLYQEAATRVATDLDEFRVTSGADGHYYIHITGFAKEPITGLVFAID